MSDLLKSMIQDLINDRTEQARVAVHDYIVAKTQEIAGLSEGEMSDQEKAEAICDWSMKSLAKLRKAFAAKKKVSEAEQTVIDRPPVKKPESRDAPDEVPGGATVMILNDNVTPAEVVVEAIMHGTGFSEAKAMSRMMKAHKEGWVPIASYASVDIAETVASKIEAHARSNGNYEHYRPFVKHKGPWPLSVEVMDADQGK